NKEGGSTMPENLVRQVLESGADLGIAFDGDGDRVIMVDHGGRIVDGDEILYAIARNRQREGLAFGGVVGTQMTNLGLELALGDLKIPFARSPVGDRYVMQELAERGWGLGGESSGHIIITDLNTTGDGIVSALQTLAAIVGFDQSLAELCRGMRKFPQSMVNVQIANGADPTASPAVRDAVSKVERKLGGNGRVLLRPSGTEPVVRVMVEGENAERVEALANELSELVAQQA
ncbi:MAG: phosphoglucosamine mutase, partial [Gammaproteobacteria bacterium]|nr:phosphoglucosamine mutase [Gammaproteobacteria bacterium]